MSQENGKHSVSGVSVFKVVPPQDGGWSLTPMENLLRGLRGANDMISLELYGVDGVINYGVRTTHAESLNGMFNAYFPTAQISSHVMGNIPGEIGEEDVGDWLALDEDEHAVVQTLGLSRASYLPLRIFDDRVIHQAEMDPLAGVIGVISSNTSHGSSDSVDRLGIRLVLRPAPENWNAPWQDLMQARRDGDDRTPRPGPTRPPSQSGSSLSSIIALAGLAAVGVGNWMLWEAGNIPGMVLFNAAALSAGALTYWLARKLRGGRKRPYLDEALVEEKLKSLAFRSELQIIRVYRNEGDEILARNGLDQVVDCIRSFDDPAGNSWEAGRQCRYSGMSAARREYKGSRLAGDNRLLGWLMGQDHDFHPFVGGSQVMEWLNPKRAEHTVLSAREAATVWHPPLGMSQMASMERIASGSLVPYLGDLSSESEDSGPLVGKAGEWDIRLPESSIEKHAIVLGRSGTGKSTLIKHIVAHKLRRKAQGKDDGAVVVIDPHADLVREILQLVPQEIAHKVRLLDFGRQDRVPGLNLVDPNLFSDRDRCVDTIIETVKHLWPTWGGRLEDLLKNSLMIVYEFNSHPSTERQEMLTMLDILLLLQDGEVSGRGRDQTTEMSAFQRHCLSRVSDPRLKQWFQMYLGWPRDTRAEAVGPVFSRIGAYAAHRRASVIMGQRETTIMLSDVLSEGLVLLVSTAQGTVGKGPAALMGGTIVSLVESALRDQEALPPSERSKCLLICDEFQTVTGADWEGLFAEIRKYGCSMMLATQSITRLDTSERRLKAGVLGNVGVIIGYQMAAEDAHVISAEMDSDWVRDNFLVNLHPHHCVVRINSSTTCYPAFSMKTLPPPDLTRGSQEAVDAVIAASLEYTTDWQEAWDSLSREMQERLDGGGPKFGAGMVPGSKGNGAAAAGDGAGSGSNYERAMGQGATDRPGPGARTARPPGSAPGSVPDSPPARAGDLNSRLAASAPARDGPGDGLDDSSGSPSRAEESGAPDPMTTESVTTGAVTAESGAVLEAVVQGDPSPEGATAGTPAPSRSKGARRRHQVRRVPADIVEKSLLDGSVIEFISDPDNEDQGVRYALDARLGQHISRAYKQAEARVEVLAAERAREMIEPAVHDAYREGVLAGRGEVVEEVTREASGRESPGPESPGPESPGPESPVQESPAGSSRPPREHGLLKRRELSV